MRIAAAVIALSVGYLAGLIAGRPAAPPRVVARAALEKPAGPAAESPDLPGLRARVEEQAAEIRRLQDPEAPAAAETGPVDGRRRSREVFELFRRAVTREDGRDYVKALGKLDELDESMTAGFIEQYEAVKDDEPMKSMGLALILMAGGRDAAAFVAEKLAGTSAKPGERDQVLQSIGPGSLFMTKQLPFDGRLASVADEMLASSNATERAGAAGLLAGANTGHARTLLRTMAESDADAQVRASAIGALGWNGDRSDLEYMESFPRQPDAWAVNHALDRAIKRLQERYPK